MSTDNMLRNISEIQDDSHTISYKVGKAILDAKNFKGLLELPLKLNEARKIHLERQMYKELPGKLRSQPNLSLESIYQQYGIKGLVISSKLSNDTKKQARELIKLASDMSGSERVSISRIALELDNSLAILRGAGWAAVHSNNLSMLEEVLVKVKEGDNLKNKDYLKTYKQFEKKLEKLKLHPQTHEENVTSKSVVFSNLSKLSELDFRKLILSNNLDKLAKNEKLLSKLVNPLYQAGGVKAVKQGIDKVFFSYNAGQKAFLYLKIGKILNSTSLNAEYELAMLALETDSKMSVLRGAFWATQRKGDFEKTAELIEMIEDKVPNKPSKKDLEFLDKVYKSPAYSLSIEKHIKSLESPAIQPAKNRIAYVLHNSLPFSSGGYATRGFGLSSALQDLGYYVYVINRPGFPIDLGNNLKDSEVDGISVINNIPHIRTLSPTRRHKRPYDYMVEAADALEIRFREYRPAIVVAASNHITAIPALIAAKRLGLPFIYEVRGFWEITRVSREPEFENKAAYKVQRLLEAMAANKADHVFTLTQPMKEELVARGIDSKKITLLPNSCNPSEFIPRVRDQALSKSLNIPNDVPVIGYIGTFVQYEGLENLVEACAILKRKNIEFRLLIVGNENATGTDRGPITEAIINTAQANEMLDWVILPGRVPHEEVSNYYSLIDITPFPRKPQPVCEMVSPMKPLEAAAMKKAIVVSSVKALKEMIIHEENGLVFEKGNVSDLAKQLERLITDTNLRKFLGENARVWVETERTWSITAQKMHRVLEEVLEDKK